MIWIDGLILLVVLGAWGHVYLMLTALSIQIAASLHVAPPWPVAPPPPVQTIGGPAKPPRTPVTLVLMDRDEQTVHDEIQLASGFHPQMFRHHGTSYVCVRSSGSRFIYRADA